MLKRSTLPALAGLAVLLAGCAASMPSGPSVMVLPGTGKNFDQFRLDDMDCRSYAQAGLGGSTPESVGSDAGARSAALGTVIGAAAGAAANGSQGAGVGAGLGLATGGLIGISQSQMSSGALQHRYDNTYQQCMYAKGNKIPGSYSSANSHAMARAPATYYAPPPPPPANFSATITR
jgi:hypothetical protein